MQRTTVTIDPPILRSVKEMGKREGKTLREVICELLVAGLRAKEQKKPLKLLNFKWHSQPMGARIDYSDKDEIYRILDKRR